ncbi:MAG: nucleotide exchange factor GrpE [Mycoplasmataceae bacterium]|jgi:molecular chaperone GrpE|nr:nucleotide exchange factor GrpE [Mycoplasmataceae bacterium]
MSEEQKKDETSEIVEGPTKEESSKKIIADLEHKLHEATNKIVRLEQQIAAANAEYGNKIKEKSEQANKIVQEKLMELESKHSSFVENHKKYGLEKDATKLVDIIDQFKKAISFETDDQKVKQFLIGFKMFSSMFENLLEDLHITIKQVKVGDEFEPSYMDAYDTTNEKSLGDNKVSHVISQAYILHDRVIKHAVVKVNKHA